MTLKEWLEALRLDRRLVERPGWITREELEQELARLPDVTGKAVLPGAETPQADGGAEGGAERDAPGS